MEVLSCARASSAVWPTQGMPPGISPQPHATQLSGSASPFQRSDVSFQSFHSRESNLRPPAGRTRGRTGTAGVPRRGLFLPGGAGHSPPASWQCCAAGGPHRQVPAGAGAEGPSAGSKRRKPDQPIVGRAMGMLASPSAAPLDESEGQLEAWEQAPLKQPEHFSTVQVAQGVASLVGLERAAAAAVQWGALPCPAPVLMLAAIGAAMALNAEASRALYDFHSGAVAFFDAWLPMFFVPSVAGIALAPMPAGGDLVKAALVLGGSYAFNLWATGKLATAVQVVLNPKPGGAVRGDGDRISHEMRLARIGRAASAWTKSFAQRGAEALSSAAERSSEAEVKQAAAAASRFLTHLADAIELPKTLPPLPPRLVPGSLLGGAALLLPLTLLPQTAANALLMTPGFLLLTVGLFTAAKGLPPQVKKWLSPTVVGGALVALLTAAYGALRLGTWQQGVGLYKEGAGAILVMLIGPAVASLGFKVHTQRALLKKSATQLVLVCLLIVPSGLLATALIGRILGASLTVTASLLPATTTLGLAREMGPLLGANRGLLVAGVTIAGTAGISTARQLMAHWKIEGAALRGMAVGASSHTLGASAIATDEPQAAAVAGLTLALKGTISVIAISFPPFRNLLLSIANPA